MKNTRNFGNLSFTFLLVLFLELVVNCYSLPECAEDAVMFTYTACDVNGDRWRVQVPKETETCEISKPVSPLKGQKCGFSCPAGSYMQLESETCELCPPGSFSLGSGIRFDAWETLPPGFIVSAESVTFSQYGYTSKVNNCSQSLWQPVGEYVVSNNDDCTSSLSYSADLNHKGTVSFSYQYSDSNILLHFYVQNGQCQTIQHNKNNVFLNTTGTEWKILKVDLEAGVNVLYWKTTGIMIGDRKKLNPVRIRDIEITGISYATECHKCRPGYFAKLKGSKWCNICPVNTHSDVGATKCTDCDKKTEYAPLASPKCLEKLPCTEKDYFATHTPCNENKTTSVMYKWTQPKLCLNTLEGSVALPQSGTQTECAPCNPGFESKGNACSKCPVNFYSDGTQSCQRCPASTAPHYGQFNLWWDSLPSNMQTSCIQFSTATCRQKEGWEAVGDEVRTLTSITGDSFLILVIRLEGFLAAYEPDKFGEISFVFQLDCTADCQFHFMKDTHNVGTSIMNSWNGNQAKQSYSYVISKNEDMLSFTWAFQKSKGNPSDTARIFLVNVTNVIDSSADACISCADGHAVDDKCIPCPIGNYLDASTKQCIPCTGNTIISANKSLCMKCGLGTTANTNHTRCLSDCLFQSKFGTSQLKYNFSSLPSTIAATALPSFTNSGQKYNHIYNISLCDNQGVGNAECIDNVTYVKSGKQNSEYITTVKGMFCRSTAVQMLGDNGEHLTLHTTPTPLASTLIEVTQKPASNSTSVSNDKFPKDDLNFKEDVVYHMSLPADRDENDKERKLFVHLRCDPSVTDVNVEFPKNCPDGTCDGTTYHFLVRSYDACPICTPDDYDVVIGACLDSKSETKYIWKNYPNRCKGGVELPVSSYEPCQDITFYINLAIAGAVALLLLMCIVMVKFWKKSKKLEYKYRRLVSSSKNGQNGELPTADSCALTDSESDGDGMTDEVVFQKKKRILGKKKVNDYNSMNLQSTNGV